MKNKRATNRGFTFIEVMVVVAILAILATLIIPRLTGRVEEAKKTKAVLQIKSIMQALELYKLDNGFYPTTEQGLLALVEKPASEPLPMKWKKYMDKIPRDPWKREFIYISPGTHGTSEFDGKTIAYGGFDLICLGPNGVEDYIKGSVTSIDSTDKKTGETQSDDIVSWDLPED